MSVIMILRITHEPCKQWDSLQGGVWVCDATNMKRIFRWLIWYEPRQVLTVVPCWDDRYCVYSTLILLPVFVVVTMVFFCMP